MTKADKAVAIHLRLVAEEKERKLAELNNSRDLARPAAKSLIERPPTGRWLKWW